ncbi:MAG: TIGR04283 family arsenosugar biosynthesis glycosyltransferase [Bacteroidota bacterium]
MISVIIPTLNEEEALPTLLDFLCKHPARNEFEVLIIDGGSSDGTLKICSERPVQVIHSEKASRAAQMNIGAAAASGDILYFVHADAVPPESFVNDIKQAQTDGFQSGCYRFRFDRKPYFLLYINEFFTRFPFSWCRGGDQTLFITKVLFEELRGYNEEHVIMEDYEFLERLQNVASFKILPKSVKVSSRKYKHNSYLQVQVANFRAMRMYKSGVPPLEIKVFYKKALTF